MRAAEPVVAFRDVKALPEHLAVPWPLWIVLSIVGGAGLVAGWLTSKDSVAHQLLSSTFYCAGGLYLAISVVDFREHFRLERELTGKSLAAQAVPIGETINHAGSILIVGLTLALPRPLAAALEPRDVVALLLPLTFLALGLRDEIVYHRRRAAHREDILHTTAHLCAGAMFAAWLPLRLIPWAVVAAR